MKSKKKILLADDGITDGKMILICLRDTADVTLCYNGKEALEKLKHEIYDLIITDLQMPKMNGYELIYAIKKLNISTPIIVTTAARDSIILKRLSNMGVSECLSKPLSLSLLRLSSFKILFGTKDPHLQSRLFNSLFTLTSKNYLIFSSLNLYITLKYRHSNSRQLINYQQINELKKSILDFRIIKKKLIALKEKLPDSYTEFYREVYFEFLQTENLCDRIYKDVLTDPPY